MKTFSRGCRGMFLPAVPDRSVAPPLKTLEWIRGREHHTGGAAAPTPRQRRAGTSANIERSQNTCGLPLTSNLTSPPRKGTTQTERVLFSCPLLTLSPHCVAVLVEPGVTLRLGKMSRKMVLGAHEGAFADVCVCQGLQQTLEAAVGCF